MTYGLLAGISSRAVELILYYGGCVFLLVLAFALFFVMKRKRKKELKISTLKKSCIKAQKYVDKLLGIKNEKNSLLASSRLLRLSGLVEDATWYAYEIAEAIKNVGVEGISNELDALANTLVNESEDGYIPQAEYLSDLQTAKDCLDSVVKKLEEM